MENKRCHLEIIQDVINRMSTNSFVLKGWLITLVAALFAFAAEKSSVLYLCVAVFPALLFWGLDGYYLWQERLFRRLYDHVRLADPEQIDFSMNTAAIRPEVQSFRRTVFSSTLTALYGTVLVSIVLVIAAGYIFGGW